ncbi:MAG: hypothetical protein WC894_01300 [Patescibacteria group bacterium]
MIKRDEVVRIGTSFFGIKEMTVKVIENLKKSSLFVARIISPAFLKGGLITKSTKDIIRK